MKEEGIKKTAALPHGKAVVEWYVVTLGDNPDPVAFWIDQKQIQNFPQLAGIAVDVLVIPASSALIERIFLPQERTQ